MQSMQDRGKILILDRTFDLTGPMCHTYSVMSLIEELMEGQPGALIQDPKDTQTCFNFDDPYW